LARDSTRADWLTRQAYAHRGLHSANAPENSLAAFAAAIDAGLGIECDVRKAGDGRAIVFHDADLDRLTAASGPMGARSVGELTSLQLAGGDERIPTLRDTLQLVAGRVPLLLEIKIDGGRPVGPLCRAVRRDCEGYRGNIAVMSFDPRVARWFAGHLPGMVRGLVVSEGGARTLSGTLRRRLAVRMAQPDFIAGDIGDLPSALMARLHKRGLPLLTWTVRTAQQLATAQQCDATPILEAAGVAAWRSGV